MTIIPIYRYSYNEYIVDSTEKPEGEYIERVRLVADRDKALTKDQQAFYFSVDIEKQEQSLWFEVDEPEENLEEE